MIGRVRTSSSRVEVVGNINAGQVFFTVGLCLWLLCRVLQTSHYVDVASSFLRLGLNGGILLCVLSELLGGGFNLRSLSLAGVVLLLVALVGRVDNNGVAYTLLIAFMSRRYRLRDLLVAALPVLTLTILLVIGSYEMGIIGQSYLNDGLRVRSSLGFGWVTYLSHYFLEFVMCYSLLRADRVRLWEVGLLAAIDVVIFSITVSRNSFILTAAFLVLLLFIRAKKTWPGGRLFASIAAASFPVSGVVSWVIYTWVNPSSALGHQLNLALNGRVALTQRALEMYGISPFGNIVTWVTQSSIRSGVYSESQYLYVDCSYINELINYGWVVFGLLMVALVVVAFKATRSSGALMGVALIIFAIHGIVDPQLLDLHYCLLLLLLGNVFDGAGEWATRLQGLVTPERGTSAKRGLRHTLAASAVSAKQAGLMRSGGRL